ncbi:alpha-L-rhamnosidase [Kribbella orskensis]|uniref:alpha-L-rhamnosidase n=1 Tax=Kribbella orskensis TaxID=2512216 RepID=A0ABY2BKB8_9ACTN|nr:MULTISPECIES: glycoside hydrolase family 78 protein [Kribbella]TCN38312.1 alpha-L-rhamnosidase [Kribbella sp. VKM Ac-2500]TCO20158.1 alpha-L-rhamnosidase [Kribbella orskensis]
MTTGWVLTDPPTVPALTPYDLRCEHLAEPLGIGSARPRLSWRLASPVRGDRQEAFRVRVERDGVQVWDSGWRSEQATSVDHGGAPLTSLTDYTWHLEVRDAAGAATGASATFATGIFHPGEWQARWIEHDYETEPPFEPPVDKVEPRSERSATLAAPRYLRRSFDLPAPVVRARVYATAHGLYQLNANGRRVGADELTPGWTDYRYRVAYQTYDVTDLLHEGENVLGAVLAEGWWSGYVGWDTRSQAHHYGKRPRLLAQLVVDHPDGTRTVIGTDAGWLERTGPLRFADLLMGESYDARLELGDWSSPGHVLGQGWERAGEAGADVSTVVAASTEPVRVMEDLPAVSVDRRGPGRYVVDLGQNVAGRIRLRIRGAAAGDRIRLRHAEMLESDGEVYTANLRTADATDYYVSAGADEETFEPAFTVHGFRYVEVDGYPGDLTTADVTGRVLHSDTPVAGRFECSDPGVNRLLGNIRWGQRGNFVSVPTDCPQRDERLGWTADAQIFLPTAAYQADVQTFFANWLEDLAVAQTPDGAVPDVIPHLITGRHGTPAWSDAATIVPWTLYRSYGDERVLRQAWPSMRRWVDFVHTANPGLIWRNRTGGHYGDWLQVGVCTDRDVLATAYFARSAELTAATARVLGLRDEAAAYGELRDRIAAAFVAEFVDAEGKVRGDTQTGYLLPLAFGLLPEDLEQEAVKHLVADLERRDRSLTTGFAGVALLCPVLAGYGQLELAYDLLHDDRYPSWGYSIRHGATTIWERWDGWTEEQGFGPVAMNSFNHYSLGSVGEWLYSGVAGIDQAPSSVAFRDLVIRPRPGGRLDWAQAAYDTPSGRVTTRWEVADGTVKLDVGVPPGTTATVHVPTADPTSVRESDRPVAGQEEIDVLGPADGVLVCRVASGRYRFAADA